MPVRSTGSSYALLVTGYRSLVVIWVLAGLAACASTGSEPVELGRIEPLVLPGERLEVTEIASRVASPDLLRVDARMREFVQLYTGELGSKRQRLHMLHRAVRSPAVLDLQYDPHAEGSAIEVFYRGTANCLSYANLFVALAREAGLEADYQWLEVRPQWTRLGERVAVSLHVNVVVDTARGEQFMADIDPLESRDITGSRRISDNEATALHHNNIAIEALTKEQLGEAWLQLVRALQLSPDLPLLWVNLGAVYRMAGQHDAAESSYLQALALDEQDRSAMTNLVILYDIQGRTAEREQWAERVARYREANPYYHAWLGEEAAAVGEWASAVRHFERALSLEPADSYLMYAAGTASYRLRDYSAARRYLNRAIEAAALISDQERYREQLALVRRDQLAGV